VTVPVPVLWAVGDGATGGTDAAAVAAMIAADLPTAFCYLGDVYESGTAAEFAANYHPSWGQLDPVCFPCPGNHDWGNYATGYEPYFAAKSRPTSTPYAVTFGDWQVLVFNSEVPSHPGSEQYRWAQAQLAPADLASNPRRRLAIWHRPRYCSGSHGDATDLDYLWQLVAPHCVAVLGGHAHNMQHFHPDATGCVQLVSGAGGRSLYAELPGDPRLEWGNAGGYGAVRLELDSVCKVRWVDEAGNALYGTTLTP
jgi:hypothetical protein